MIDRPLQLQKAEAAAQQQLSLLAFLGDLGVTLRTALRAAAAASRCWFHSHLLGKMRCSVLPLVVTLLLLLPPVAMETQENDFKDGCQGAALQDGEHDCTWSCIIFTLQWPGGFCASLFNETLCRIPDGVTGWTIHGLWPQHAQRCCSCWPMFHSDVQELEDELAEYWPSLLTTRSRFQFWKQEWSKHGACAACVEGFNSPQKYFQISLKLRQSFEIQRILEDAGITPSCERRYKVAEVQSVLTPHVGDQYEIQCVVDHRDRQVWFQVKIRMSRDLTLGCSHPDAGSGPGSEPSPGHPCPPEVPFFYFPINHQQPERPCD
ncbi:Ribonuclease Oy [Oryzias melastigma]|uniref:Ribonuclease Oy n=1 Tax=Oryzias melastigma TaxID=30732 RepID=A0A834CG68_ORYME|nr:Ribonuclease Oy [Oryzias melastigma]